MTKYKVTAKTGFDEHKLGDEFEADLDPDLEQRALDRGSIEVVTKSRKKKEEDSDA